MPITLTKAEMRYLVALYGDIPMKKRERLFRFASFPAQAGPLVMQGGYDFRAELDDGRILYRKRGSHPAIEKQSVKRV